MLLPLLVLPTIAWLDEKVEARDVRALRVFAGLALLSVVHQAALVLVEPFAVLHVHRAAATARGEDPFAGNQIHFDWAASPLASALSGASPVDRAPCLLRGLPLGDGLLALALASLVALAVALALRATRAERR
jgi:hypothetical protein